MRGHFRRMLSTSPTAYRSGFRTTPAIRTRGRAQDEPEDEHGLDESEPMREGGAGVGERGEHELERGLARDLEREVERDVERDPEECGAIVGPGAERRHGRRDRHDGRDRRDRPAVEG
jgi:hypothetical protein